MVWVLIETDSTSVESSNVVVSQLSNYHMGSDGASSFIYNSDTAPIESMNYLLMENRRDEDQLCS
jgi:hypothetical protein